MRVGASYYPELLPETEWEADLATGRELGLSCLRCGEFAWSSFSPEPETWNTDWACRFLDLAHRLGFEVIWCTPTATPPPYLFDRWPDLQAQTSDGRRPPVGVRRNYCPTHAGYLELGATTAGRLARDLGGCKAIAGWQVDNELAGDGFTCWCEGCRKAFQVWLADRYESLEKLNGAWQTSLWSQRYSAWSQIPSPRAPAGSHAPAIRLDYRRFLSDAWKRFYSVQADALRLGGARNITTNFFDFAWDMPFDHWQWQAGLDAAGLSHYVEGEIESRFVLAVARSVAQAKPLWVLEQKAGHQAGQNLFPDDLSRLKSHLSRCAEAGAAYAIYWHLRQHSAGCEMEHGAVLRHDGKPTRIARAVQQAIHQTQTLKPAKLAEDAVLIFSFQQQWANANRPQPTKWDYRTRIEQDWYAGARDVLGELQINCVGNLKAPPKLLIAPLCQMQEPGLLAAIDACLKQGGVVLTTADLCRLDEHNNVQRHRPLGCLNRWVEVPELEMFNLREGTFIAGRLTNSKVTGSLFWAVPQSTTTIGAELLGQLAFEGMQSPAALQFAVGSGRLIVALTELDRSGVAALLAAT